MRSLQQRLTEKVLFSFASGDSLGVPFLEGKGGTVSENSAYAQQRNSDIVICDVYGKGVISGFMTALLSPDGDEASVDGISGSAGGDYQLKIEIDGRVYNLTNPSSVEYGGDYNFKRGVHWLNCPWYGGDYTKVRSMDDLIVSGYGVRFGSHLKVTINQPTTSSGGYINKSSVVLYKLFSDIDTMVEYEV